MRHISTHKLQQLRSSSLIERGRQRINDDGILLPEHVNSIDTLFRQGLDKLQFSQRIAVNPDIVHALPIQQIKTLRFATTYHLSPNRHSVTQYRQQARKLEHPIVDQNLDYIYSMVSLWLSSTKQKKKRGYASSPTESKQPVYFRITRTQLCTKQGCREYKTHH